jgi:S-DNA-T family DNA segregation ATPase FtsK/SpoIIIE
MASKASKSTAKKSPSRSKGRSGRKAKSAKTSRGKSASRVSKKSQPLRAPAFLSGGISLDRKLDIVGTLLALIGLLTTFSLLSSSRGALTGGWINLLGMGFGWGMYLLPLTLIAIGLWLILRNFERIPLISLERLVGLILLFASLLTVLTLATMPETGEMAYSLASQGKGGGYIGALAYQALKTTLGVGGAVVALIALLLIALTLLLDVSISDLFGWAPTLVERIQDTLIELQARKNAAARQGSASAGYTPASPDDAAATSLEAAGIPQMPTSILSTPGEQPLEWELPTISDILDAGGEIIYDDDYDRQRARVIEETLASFGAPANVVEISRGPTITMFGVEPDFIETRSGRTRVRVNKISSLADDLALALSARTIRIQAPVPGKGYVGIEVPNDEIALVALRDVIESEAYKRLKVQLRFALGQDVAGNAVAADLTAMPHLLIAGATGSGKSVCVNSLISCLLLHNTPDDLRIVMVDPKRVELTGYNGIPHLLAPVVVELERVVGALQWVTREMDQRYHKLAQAGCRNVYDYNAKLEANGEKKLPYLVVIIDELADLMMLAPDETERTLTRLAQLARATGIHLIISTQRPSVDVVTGIIKANFPARIAFAVASGVDSRVILDQPGAERLLGRGDMLFQAPDAAAPVRLQGTFVADSEIQRLVYYWQSFAGTASPAPTASGGIVDTPPQILPLKQMPLWEEMETEQNTDPLLNEAVDLVRRQGRASVSMLQRRLRIGYTRAARLVETMEEKGIVGPPTTGTGVREVLDYGPAAPPVDE